MTLSYYTGKSNLDHLVKVVSASFLHCKVIIFTLIHILGETALKLMQIHFLLELLPTNFTVLLLNLT